MSEFKETLAIKYGTTFSASSYRNWGTKGHRTGKWWTGTEPESPCSQISAVLGTHTYTHAHGTAGRQQEKSLWIIEKEA